jgi:hypothetical protein
MHGLGSVIPVCAYLIKSNAAVGPIRGDLKPAPGRRMGGRPSIAQSFAALAEQLGFLDNERKHLFCAACSRIVHFGRNEQEEGERMVRSLGVARDQLLMPATKMRAIRPPKVRYVYVGIVTDFVFLRTSLARRPNVCVRTMTISRRLITSLPSGAKG